MDWSKANLIHTNKDITNLIDKVSKNEAKIIENMSNNNELITVYLAQADKSYLYSRIALIISTISVPVVII